MNLRCIMGNHDYEKISDTKIYITAGIAKGCVGHKTRCRHCGKEMTNITGVHQLVTKEEGPQ